MSSAGTAPDAVCVVSADLIEWADDVLVMERKQREFIRKRFGASLAEKRMVCLGVADKFDYMQDELVALLRAKVLPLLPVSDKEI